MFRIERHNRLTLTVPAKETPWNPWTLTFYCTLHWGKRTELITIHRSKHGLFSVYGMIIFELLCKVFHEVKNLTWCIKFCFWKKYCSAVKSRLKVTNAWRMCFFPLINSVFSQLTQVICCTIYAGHISTVFMSRLIFRIPFFPSSWNELKNTMEKKNNNKQCY